MEKDGALPPMKHTDHNNISYTVSDLISEVERNTDLGITIVAISGLLRYNI